VLREDRKLKEISKPRGCLYIVNCLIPNIDKFNEVEDRIITNYLPKFCFKEVQHKKQKADDLGEANSPSVNNITPTPPEFISKKRKSDTRKPTITKELNNININNPVSVGGGKNNNTIGVKLMCDDNNEELRKYFSKTVFYELILETLY
jgi:hypothetical protein